MAALVGYLFDLRFTQTEQATIELQRLLDVPHRHARVVEARGDAYSLASLLGHIFTH